jgi:hypothetical protein
MERFQWWRRLLGGTWYYLRPYDNLYQFSHLRYWKRRKPLSTEVLLKRERWCSKNYT